jgi:putative copper resistance protein D
MWMTDGSVAWLGLTLDLAAAAAYVVAASRRSPRGARWPRGRTVAFVLGLLVIAFALDSPIAAHDDVPPVHVLQHGLLMMLAPMLLALGAPVTLAMRTMSGHGRRRTRALLHDPGVRGLVTRPVVLIADYNLTMALMLWAPAYRLGERHLAIHIAAHVYLVLCGLLFWTAMLARDPVPGRLPGRTRRLAVMLGIPLNLGLAAAVSLAPATFIGAGQHEAHAAAQMLVALVGTTSILGVLQIGVRHGGGRSPGRYLSYVAMARRDSAVRIAPRATITPTHTASSPATQPLITSERMPTIT